MCLSPAEALFHFCSLAPCLSCCPCAWPRWGERLGRWKRSHHEDWPFRLRFGPRWADTNEHVQGHPSSSVSWRPLRIDASITVIASFRPRMEGLVGCRKERATGGPPRHSLGMKRTTEYRTARLRASRESTLDGTHRQSTGPSSLSPPAWGVIQGGRMTVPCRI